MYYFRQLSVHNCINNYAEFFRYHEGTADKGPSEVCSFLHQYINDNISPSITELYLFSDNCPGQNKNHVMVRFLLALTDSGRFNKIIYKVPMRGHSYLPCDRDFALVKKKLKMNDRYYTMNELTEMIAHSSLGRFTVRLVPTESVKEFRIWWPGFYKKNSVAIETMHMKKSRREGFSISKFHEFHFDSSKKGQLFALRYVVGTGLSQQRTFNLAIEQARNVSFPQESAYTGPRPIHAAKVKDISKMMTYIPNEAQEFFKTIVNGPTRTGSKKKND